jgi:hypothetical protein
MESDEKKSEVNYEKIGVYTAIMIGFLTLMFYIVDIKVDVAKLQIKVEHLEGIINVKYEIKK